MAKVSSFVFLGGVALFIGWRAQISSEQAAEKRAAVIEAYHLDSRQGEIYDGCLDALQHKTLRQGGEKEPFCGCLSKSVADAYDSPKAAREGIGVLVDIATNSIKPNAALAAFQRDSNSLARLKRTAVAIRQCAEDQRARFTSTAEARHWCEEKPERSIDAVCTTR